MLHWKWHKSDLKNVDNNGLKVLSTFSCGGGSSYGYKLAGYEVLGNVEIDHKINAMYVKNHRPKYNFRMDIREFNQLESIPEELRNLDILDGSPPCSTFSMAGSREKAWGVEKKFREGQKKQVLDDLFMEFMHTVSILRPKVVVAENVDGMTRGKSRYYITMVINEFKKLGYDVQMFRLNAMFMGVPQSRVRIFFVANRMNFPPLVMNPNERPIPYGKIASRTAKPISKSTKAYGLMKHHMLPSDNSIGDINERVYGKLSNFNTPIFRFSKVCPTITANSAAYREDICHVPDADIISASTFPQDYDFNGNQVKYVCGMSVPPLMMAYIARQIHRQWFKQR